MIMAGHEAVTKEILSMTTQRLTAEQAREKHYSRLRSKILDVARLTTCLNIRLDSRAESLFKSLGYEYKDGFLLWARDSVPITAEHPILPSALEARQRFDTDRQLNAVLKEIGDACWDGYGQMFIKLSSDVKGYDTFLHQKTIDALVELGYDVSSTSLYDYRVSWGV